MISLPPTPLSIKQAAAALGVSKNTIHRAIAGGRLKALRFEATTLRIDVAELIRYREASVEQPNLIQTPRGMVRAVSTSSSPSTKRAMPKSVAASLQHPA